jgi:uncharacterized protein with HEPN domain
LNERDRLYLGHILAAIEAAFSFCIDGREVFMTDLKTHSAVIRQIEIIGEAVKRLSPDARAAEPGIPWREIAGTRDRLIHGYFQVDLAAVWVMVERDLPVLLRAVERLRAGS